MALKYRWYGTRDNVIDPKCRCFGDDAEEGEVFPLCEICGQGDDGRVCADCWSPALAQHGYTLIDCPVHKPRS